MPPPPPDALGLDWLFGHAPDAVFAAAADTGRVAYCNAAAERLFGQAATGQKNPGAPFSGIANERQAESRPREGCFQDRDRLRLGRSLL